MALYCSVVLVGVRVFLLFFFPDVVGFLLFDILVTLLEVLFIVESRWVDVIFSLLIVVCEVVLVRIVHNVVRQSTSLGKRVHRVRVGVEIVSDNFRRRLDLFVIAGVLITIGLLDHRLRLDLLLLV